MLFALSLAIFYGIFSRISARQCDQANYICSGRCPDVPSNVQLTEGESVCRKDVETSACICWVQSTTSLRANSLFLCEAKVNGTETPLLCQPPDHCFPPDNEPTCLVITNCDCMYLNNDESMIEESGKWKLVKAFVQTAEHSRKYPSDVREFSLKHLLFLLGFVIAPLFCWCVLNFSNSNRCKQKKFRQTCVPISPEGRATDIHVPQNMPEHIQPDEPLMLDVDCNTDQSAPPNIPCVCIDNSICTSSDFNAIPTVSSNVTSRKFESPPSYDKAVNDESEHDDDRPPPSYEDAVRFGGPAISWSTQTYSMTNSDLHSH